MIKFAFLLPFLFSALGTCINAERYIPPTFGFSVSLEALLPLLKLQEKTVANLRSYAQTLQQQLVDVQLAIRMYEDLQRKATLNSMNLMHQFSVIRHMHLDWAKWLTVMRAPKEQIQIQILKELQPQMPTNMDLVEALKGLQRIQYTWDLEPADIARGNLHGRQYKVKRWGAFETFVLGVFCQLQGYYKDADAWLKLTRDSYRRHPNPRQLGFRHWTYDHVLEYLMLANIGLGKFEAALEHAKELLVLQPYDKFFQGKVQELGTKSDEQKPKSSLPIDVDAKLLKRLCRQHQSPPAGRLHCRYMRGVDFLRLAPLKMEELSLMPLISLYHDILSDEELAMVRRLASPLLKRNKITYREIDSFTDYTATRPWQSAELSSSMHKIISSLNRRIHQASGASSPQSDDLQVRNFGIGGHFLEPPPGDPAVVTALLYLSNVEQGGETHFPSLNLRVTPQKGSLLVWPRTGDYHIECPVIVGNKWVATKQIE
ncbi:prolyl 4-hydroxylase subunit alpha-1-like [Drosophila miranda]|uniref:prolyl 4-hydroxylase subunit alpha-1-like n=1 Tax=Drosophila miranda TaxID=7229 RepID=UPI0007E63E91|nr:prolyl 4-hydroxylase subunit alpha-1-like [Drosophila miranda]XP_033243518.1 prolyl 4-hydroxylase subunit alpha-1-like [Drosophila miranda]